MSIDELRTILRMHDSRMDRYSKRIGELEDDAREISALKEQVRQVAEATRACAASIKSIEKKIALMEERRQAARDEDREKRQAESRQSESSKRARRNWLITTGIAIVVAMATIIGLLIQILEKAPG